MKYLRICYVCKHTIVGLNERGGLPPVLAKDEWPSHGVCDDCLPSETGRIQRELAEAQQLEALRSHDYERADDLYELEATTKK